MMSKRKLQGLIAATYTPLRDNNELNLDQIAPMTERLIESGVTGLYVCGSTGEGMSLSSDQRRAVTEAYTKCVAGRVPVIVQVGHNSLTEARDLAAHAAQAGADVISATCPSYFKVESVDTLIDCMAEISAAAPERPFYYYHVPGLTGSKLDMLQFLQQGSDRIPGLAGLKFTDTLLHEFQQCLELEDGRFDVVWGADEMLLGAMATGAQAAIGSTYNIAAPLYGRLINAFKAGDLAEARRLQSLSITMIQTIAAFPFHPAMKEVLRMLGFDFGRCRLPQPSMSSADAGKLQKELDAIGFFEWNQ